MTDELDEVLARTKRELEEVRRQLEASRDDQLETLRRALVAVRVECEQLEVQLAPLRAEEVRLRS